MSDVLVFFVAGSVDDEIARAVRDRVTALARSRPSAHLGFFDDPAAVEPAARTTGGYLRPAGAFEVDALWALALALSAELRVTLELQWREAVLGRVRAGVPDAGLESAVRGLRLGS